MLPLSGKPQLSNLFDTTFTERLVQNSSFNASEFFNIQKKRKSTKQNKTSPTVHRHFLGVQMSRRDEIEAKKLRLQELRRLREEKDRTARKSLPSTLGSDGIIARKSRVDDLVNSLVGDGNVLSNGKAAADAASASASAAAKSLHASKAVQTSEGLVKSKKVLTYNKSTQTVDYEALALEEERREIAQKLERDTVSETQEIPDDQAPIADVTEVDQDLLSSFLHDSLKVIDRVIDEDKDILLRYTNLKKQAIEEMQTHVQLQSLKFDHGIYSIDTSPFLPEIIAMSTGNNIYIYNTKFNQYEKQYKTTTKILNIQFSKFQPTQLVGTGFNGKVHIWDFENFIKFPILESTVSLETHAYPVWCLNQLNENNGVLITSSTDGRIVTWDPRILSKPMSEPIELTIPRSLTLRYDELTPLVTCTLSNELGFLIVGAEDGNIYKIKRFDNMVNANPEKIIDTIYQAHSGPITSISPSLKFPHLFLSSAFDWKVYLWDSRNDEEPIFEIYKNEAIMDCSWRTDHPTQIGYIYENVFELLDLSIDTVTPIAKITTEHILNKLQFGKDGSRVLLGTVKGDLLIYELLTDHIKSEIWKFKRLFRC